VLIKDAEKLLDQLTKDQEAVEQVRAIVQEEELIMKEETEVVEEYAKVRRILAFSVISV
jgi:hypothetical protein